MFYSKHNLKCWHCAACLCSDSCMLACVCNKSRQACVFLAAVTTPLLAICRGQQQHQTGRHRPHHPVCQHLSLCQLSVPALCTSPQTHTKRLCHAPLYTEASSNTKLAGTALTILGGLAQWYISHPDVLSSVLTVFSSVLRSPDPKLARNAATTVSTLCVRSVVCARHAASLNCACGPLCAERPTLGRMSNAWKTILRVCPCMTMQTTPSLCHCRGAHAHNRPTLMNARRKHAHIHAYV